MKAEELSQGPLRHVGNGYIHNADDRLIGRFLREADAEQAVLASAAFDVMMRRGWYPEKGAVEGKSRDNWFVYIREDGYFWCGDGFSDPFTALVEADKWYKEHVEALPASMFGKPIDYVEHLPGDDSAPIFKKPDDPCKSV